MPTARDLCGVGLWPAVARSASLLALTLLLTSCGVLEAVPGADPHEAWSTTLDQRFIDPHPAVTAGKFICFAYDNDWARDNFHRNGPGVFTGVDAATGRIVWKQPATLNTADAGIEEQMNSLILIGEGMVFYRADDNAIHALDAATGKEKWRAEKAGNLLAVGAGVVAMSNSDYHVELREVATGVVRSKLDKGHFRDTALIGGDTLYLASDGTDAISLTTGKQLWHTKRDFKLQRVFDGMLICELTYASEIHALRTSDGTEAWKSEGHLAGSSAGVIAIERMQVGPQYVIHKIEAGSGKELSEEGQDQYKRDFKFHEDLAVGGVAFAVPYTDHYGYTYQRLHVYSPEAISKDEWIEAHEPGGEQMYWRSAKTWGWVSTLVATSNLVIRGETTLHDGKARIRAWRATKEKA